MNIARSFGLISRNVLRRNPSLQIVTLLGFWLLGEALVRSTGVPVSGGIAGMFIVIALFATGRFSPANLRRGSEWFLEEMLLFFAPAVPAVLGHHEFLGWLGLKILAVILIGTLTVMVVTACAVDACVRWFFRHDTTEGSRS